MLTYEYYDNIELSDNSGKIIIDHTNENSRYGKNTGYITVKNESGCEEIFAIYYLNCTGLKPKIISADDLLIVGVDFGAAVINNSLKISNVIHSDYLFCGCLFYCEKIILVFECEIAIYNVQKNLVESQIPLKDMVDDYRICGNNFIYNTIEKADYEIIALK